MYVVAILALVIIIINIIASNIADTKIRKALQKNYPGLSIDLNNVRVNIVNRSVKLSGIELLPDTSSLDFRINIGELKITGIGIFGLISGKSADIRKVELKRPEIKGNLDFLINRNKDKKAVNHKTGTPDTGKSFSAHIHKIYLADARFDSVIMPGIVSFQDIENATVKLYDFKLNTGADSTHYTIGDALMNLETARITLPGDYYDIKFSGLQIRMKDSIVKIDSFNMIPRYGKYEFGKVKGKQTDRFEVGIGKLGIQGFDMNTMLKNEGLLVRNININGLLLHIFRDKRLPFDYTNFPPLPPQALNKLKFPFTVNHINVSDMFVEYSEVNNVSDNPGIVFLTDLKINVINLANRQSNSTKENILIQGEGMLLGECPVKGDFTLPINAINDTFYFSGAAGELDMTKLNQMVKPLSNVQITGGNLHSAEYHGSANGDYSGGTFMMLYKDLSFEILKGKNKDEPAKAKGFLSFVAGAVARDKNPMPGNDPKIVEMYFERDKNKGFFNFFWKSLLSGIKSTALPGHNINQEKDQKDKDDKRKKSRRGDKKS